VQGPATQEPTVDTPRGRTWQRVCGLGDFGDSSTLVVQVGHRSIGLVRLGDSVHAMLNQCPHQGAPLFKGALPNGTMLPSEPDELLYGLDGSVIRCPLHGWEFDVTSGAALFGICNKRVVTYPVEVREGEVYLLIAQREA
jgi:nitrite reductase (NADH) small subunit